MKIKYRKGRNAEYEEEGTYTDDIDDFIEAIHECLEKGVVILSIMPDDGTHYTYIIQWTNKEDKWLSVEDATNNWHVIIPKYMSPCFLKKSLENINPWTAAMVCDLVNRICGTHHQSFYDWNESVPIYVLEDVVPQGWESRESEECDE